MTVRRLTSDSVRRLLSQQPDTAATEVHLLLMQCTIDGFLREDLALPERIRGVLAGLIFLQYWHHWILDNPQYILKDNFITHNAYLHKEINAHGLLSYLFLCQEHSLPFQPWLLGSQPCELTFRAARRMSSVFLTVVNFSLLSLLHCFYGLKI